MNADNSSARAVYRANVFWLFVITALFSSAWLWLWWSPAPLGKPLFTVSNLAIVGSSDLCPGDALHLRNTVIVSQAGVVELDVTVWATEPRRMILGRPTQRMVVGQERQWPVEWQLPLPTTYVNPRTAQMEALQPGDYFLVMAITTVSQNTQASMGTVSFTIREGCN